MSTEIFFSSTALILAAVALAMVMCLSGDSKRISHIDHCIMSNTMNKLENMEERLAEIENDIYDKDYQSENKTQYRLLGE